MTAVASEVVAPRLFSQPRSLVVLTFTDAWERFSYYGITALLVLYMTQSLLLPGHIESVVGLATVRGVLGHAGAPLKPLALASQIFGLYAALAYFAPVLGGLIADRWLGRRLCVIIGAIALILGQLALILDETFLLALALLICGAGLVKGNITAQVGDLYSPADDERRTRGFAIFSTGINLGAIAGPLLCGLVAQIFDWRWAFGLAAALMLLGLLTYLAGARDLPVAARHAASTNETSALTRHDGRVVATLVAVMLITVFQSVAAFQSLAIGLVWIHARVDLNLWGFSTPVAWFAALIPLAGVVGLPLVLGFWRWQAARGHEPGPMGKIALGAGLAVIGNLVLVLGSLARGGVPIAAPIACNLILGLAYLYYWPTLLALVSGAAPARFKSVMVSGVFLSLFVASLVVGGLGGLYETLGDTRFWALHAAIAATGAVLAMVSAGLVRRGLAAN